MVGYKDQGGIEPAYKGPDGIEQSGLPKSDEVAWNADPKHEMHKKSNEFNHLSFERTSQKNMLEGSACHVKYT